MTTTRHRTAIVAATAALTLTLALCLLVLPDAADAALQKLAGYETGGDNRFGSSTATWRTCVMRSSR